MKQENTIKSYSDKDLFDRIFQFSAMKLEKGEKFHLLLKFEDNNDITIVPSDSNLFLLVFKNKNYLICSVDLNEKSGYYVDNKGSKIVKLTYDETKDYFLKNMENINLTEDSKYHLEKETFQVV